MAKRTPTEKKIYKLGSPAKGTIPAARKAATTRATRLKPSRSRKTTAPRQSASARAFEPVADGAVRPTLPVVGMVASAGGLEAYTKFFKAMPADSGVAFVLILNLDPTHESLMVPLLARHTAMPVVEAIEGAHLESNRVYIVPPNKYLALHQGVLHLRGPIEQDEAEIAIDALRLEMRVSERTTQLETQRNLLNSVLDSMVDAVITINEQGIVQSVNRAGEQMFGYKADEIIGRNVSILMPEPHHREHDGYIARYLSSGEPKIIGIGRELVAQRRDGSIIPVRLTVTEIVIEDRRLFIGMLRDLTEQSRVEKLAADRWAELTHLHRLYTAGELAAVMAHELNQPLTAIAGYSEAGLQRLRRGDFESEALISDLDKIALQAQRAGYVIRELRKFLTRDELRELEKVDLDALTRAVIELVTPQARANDIRLIFMPAAEPLIVLVSDVQIEHVLVNLVQNAIEAICGAGKSGGTITLRAAVEPGGLAHLSVQDDGPGFDGEIPEQLFERFYTTKPDGLGMGLAISRAIIKSYDGKIWAERPAEGGAMFHFTLPRQA